MYSDKIVVSLRTDYFYKVKYLKEKLFMGAKFIILKLMIFNGSFRKDS